MRDRTALRPPPAGVETESRRRQDGTGEMRIKETGGFIDAPDFILWPTNHDFSAADEICTFFQRLLRAG